MYKRQAPQLNTQVSRPARAVLWYTDKHIPVGEGTVRVDFWVIMYYYPIAWAATQCLQRVYFHFWRVDAVMQGA